MTPFEEFLVSNIEEICSGVSSSTVGDIYDRQRPRGLTRSEAIEGYEDFFAKSFFSPSKNGETIVDSAGSYGDRDPLDVVSSAKPSEMYGMNMQYSYLLKKTVQISSCLTAVMKRMDEGRYKGKLNRSQVHDAIAKVNKSCDFNRQVVKLTEERLDPSSMTGVGTLPVSKDHHLNYGGEDISEGFAKKVADQIRSEALALVILGVAEMSLKDRVARSQFLPEELGRFIEIFADVPEDEKKAYLLKSLSPLPKGGMYSWVGFDVEGYAALKPLTEAAEPEMSGDVWKQVKRWGVVEGKIVRCFKLKDLDGKVRDFEGMSLDRKTLALKEMGFVEAMVSFRSHGGYEASKGWYVPKMTEEAGGMGYICLPKDVLKKMWDENKEAVSLAE